MKKFFKKVADRIDKLDAADRRHQFEALANEIGFLESVFNTLSEGVLVIDASGMLMYSNSIAERLAACPFSRGRGKPLPRPRESGILAPHERKNAPHHPDVRRKGQRRPDRGGGPAAGSAQPWRPQRVPAHRRHQARARPFLERHALAQASPRFAGHPPDAQEG